MFGNNKRNGNGHGMAVASITTLIAEGTVIRGDVEFTGGLHLDGRIEGAISADGADAVLTLSDKGRVMGEIRASNAIINGRVEGDIVVGERLELAAGARIEGNVYYKMLEMAAGAQVNGKMIYQPEAPRQLTGPDLAVAEA
jgi:cytoskeletal protein CcmA (bactofilin family)